jgi:hypothetical protein
MADDKPIRVRGTDGEGNEIEATIRPGEPGYDALKSIGGDYSIGPLRLGDLSLNELLAKAIPPGDHSYITEAQPLSREAMLALIAKIKPQEFPRPKKGL